MNKCPQPTLPPCTLSSVFIILMFSLKIDQRTGRTFTDSNTVRTYIQSILCEVLPATYETKLLKHGKKKHIFQRVEDSVRVAILCDGGGCDALALNFASVKNCRLAI